MVNELLLNAVEHGVGERPHGEIEIVLQDLGDQVEVTIADDGHGLPRGFDPLHHASLGLQIVRALATDDLKGAFRLESGQAVATPLHEGAPVAEIVGTRALVTFPKRPLQVD